MKNVCNASNSRFGSVVPTSVEKSIGFALFIAKIPTKVGTTGAKKAKAGIAVAMLS